MNKEEMRDHSLFPWSRTITVFVSSLPFFLLLILSAWRGSHSLCFCHCSRTQTHHHHHPSSSSLADDDWPLSSSLCPESIITPLASEGAAKGALQSYSQTRDSGAGRRGKTTAPPSQTNGSRSFNQNLTKVWDKVGLRGICEYFAGRTGDNWGLWTWGRCHYRGDCAGVSDAALWGVNVRKGYVVKSYDPFLQ